MSNSLSKNNIQWVAFFLCLLGMLVSSWTIWMHVKAHLDPGYGDSTVLGALLIPREADTSRQTILFNLPLPVINAVYYFFISALVLISLVEKSERHAAVSCAVGFLRVLISSVVLIMLRVKSGSLCMGSIALFAVDIVVALLLKQKLKPDRGFVSYLLFHCRSILKNPWFLLQIGAVGAFLTIAGPVGMFPGYWEVASWRTGVLQDFGMTEGRLPWIGNVSGTVVIDEFFDYECPACRKIHAKVRKRLLHHDKTIRLVRHDFSRTDCIKDDRFPDRCIEARGAYCAAAENKYWEFNDAVIARLNLIPTRMKRKDIEDVALIVGIKETEFLTCLNSQAAFDHVQAVREDGLKQRITATPTYFWGNKKIASNKILSTIDGL